MDMQQKIWAIKLTAFLHVLIDYVLSSDNSNDIYSSLKKSVLDQDPKET